MKLSIIILGTFFLLVKLSNAQDSKEFFFDEFLVSLNRTNLQDNNTENRGGFGLGTYHTFNSEKKIHAVFGLEYNRTSQFKKNIYQGRFMYLSDLTYNINCFSLPFGFRFNLGSNIIFMIETGVFADIVIKANRKGVSHSFDYTLDENSQITYTENKIDDNARLSNSIGLYCGVGVRIPILKYEIVVKPDYKIGFRNLESYQNEFFNRYFRINVGIKI